VRPARAVLSSLLAFVTACSLFLDTNEFAGQAPAADGATPDGLSPADGSTPNDDGGNTSDAPNDAPPLDAGDCDGATFCDSFDDNAALGARWTAVSLQNTVPLYFADAAVSPPHSLEMDFLARDAGGYRRAQLKKDFSPFPKAISCTMQLFDGTAVALPSEGFGIFTFAPTTNVNGYLIEVKIKPGDKLRMEESTDTGATVATTSSTTPIIVGKWSTLTVQTDFTTASFTLDGITRSITLANPGAATADGGSTNLTVSIGEDSDVDDEAFFDRFDDFSCTVTP